ncbi:MAG TPA: putative glycolipid-binding domain-containing protein [Pyrinomonadaceae bacterium]|nr:putative glycolipid-binding domain-containing protein [Pyrinomonadaceae bacterium]
MSKQSILWRRLDKPGHEFARLFLDNSCWQLNGTAVFVHDKKPCRLDYRLKCSSEWETLAGRISGSIGEKPIEIEISVEPNRRWRLNGQECAQVAGCIDLDLNFSPLTNTLPIRRLNLNIGEKAEVCAAWLKFPGFQIEPLGQSYYRIDRATYRYESSGGRFAANLKVNETGFVTDYPNLWQIEHDF